MAQVECLLHELTTCSSGCADNQDSQPISPAMRSGFIGSRFWSLSDQGKSQRQTVKKQDQNNKFHGPLILMLFDSHSQQLFVLVFRASGSALTQQVLRKETPAL